MLDWIHPFYCGQPARDTFDKTLLGGKGANLAAMCAQGLPVPPGLTISTDACAWYYETKGPFSELFITALKKEVIELGKRLGRGFGDSANPLLLSVRSGARVSMPGMMDTVLNLGLNDDTVRGLVAVSRNERFAWDCYRRFVQMFGNVVMGVPHHRFEDIVEDEKARRNVTDDTAMPAEAWRDLVQKFSDLIREDVGEPFPQDPFIQLERAIVAVFESWMSNRARMYRKLHRIPGEWGTAVTVQGMVFGNRGDACATGVAFTRDPATGHRTIFGEYLLNAQGEDVVAGIRTPIPILSKPGASDDLSLGDVLPEAWAELQEVAARLERHFGDMQDIEFTIEDGKLFILQTRAGKRSTQAAMRIGIDLVKENIIDREEALNRIAPSTLEHVLHPRLDPDAPRNVITRGLPASPGAASGRLVFTAGEAERLANDGQDVIMVRTETSPEDILGMHASRGILTSRGGMTSHAAVVARSMGRVCISGAKDLHIDARKRLVTIGNKTYTGDDIVTLDGNCGDVFSGRIRTLPPQLTAEFKTVMTWADQCRRLRVRANADTPDEARTALSFGAEGIGLCRTEHMFFHADRIGHMRRMIMAGDSTERRLALDALHPFQTGDFKAILALMGDRPVTVRLLDPPLHEFLPHDASEYNSIAKLMGVDTATLERRAAMLREANPMLGHRGCRLLISYPEIIEMQCRSLFQAGASLIKDGNSPVNIEIMIPLVASVDEFKICRQVVDRVAKDVASQFRHMPDYSVGTMIELPRAALCAGDIAEFADFFSFGTNDLTQTTWGISRDDSSSFLSEYEKKGVLNVDPFISLDQEGVGQLIAQAVTAARRRRPDIKMGICGEHGGDPDSIDFFNRVGLDYVSCSPYRLPIARLAAAQSSLREPSGK